MFVEYDRFEYLPAYVNTELRWQVAEIQNRLVPVKVGARAFYDVGRVWADNDPPSADYWHQDYGAGLLRGAVRESVSAECELRGFGRRIVPDHVWYWCFFLRF